MLRTVLVGVERVNGGLRPTNGIPAGDLVIVERHGRPEVQERAPGHCPLSIVVCAVGDVFPLDAGCWPDRRVGNLPVNCLGPRVLQPLERPAALKAIRTPWTYSSSVNCSASQRELSWHVPSGM